MKHQVSRRHMFATVGAALGGLLSLTAARTLRIGYVPALTGEG